MATPTVWSVALTISLWTVVGSNYLRIAPVATENDREKLLDAWKRMDDNVLSITDTALKLALPFLTRMGVEAEVETECAGSLLKLLRGIKNQEDWAFKMLDASGKLFSGLYSGTISSFGTFDQCVAIEVPDPYDSERLQLRGKYCTVDFRQILPQKKRYTRMNDVIEELSNFTAKTSIVRRFVSLARYSYFLATRIGMCVPSTCTDQDIGKLITYVSDKVLLVGSVNRCETLEENVFENDQIVIISMFSLLGLLVVIGTTLEVIPTYLKKSETVQDVPIWKKLLLAFSVQSNVKKLLHTDNVTEETLPALHGIKFLSMSWVILGHTYLQMNWQTLRQLDVARIEIRKFAFQAVINALMSVDTFFFITGLLVCYITLGVTNKYGKKVFNTPLFLIRRIWRLLPPTLFVIALTILIPYVGSGPLWHDTIDLVVDNCRQNWWANALFINNFFKGSDTCLPQTWYTATDMQLYCLALLFVLLMLKKPTYAVVFSVFMILASIAVTATINIYFELMPTALQGSQDPLELVDHYDLTQFKPHAHVSPYFIGLLMGYLLRVSQQTSFRIRPHVQFFLWLTSLGMAMSVLYGTHNWNRDKEATVLESTLYSSLFRTAWVLAIGWMTFACCTGRGGVINSILSWKAMVPMSRLTFMAYLLHCLVIWFYYGNMQGLGDGQQITAVWLFFGFMVVTFAASFICHILFEAPFMQLERVLLSLLFKSSKSNRPDGEKTPTDSTSPKEAFKHSAIFIKENEPKIVTIHTIDSNQNYKNAVFTGYGRRLNGEIAKDAPSGRFQYLT